MHLYTLNLYKDLKSMKLHIYTIPSFRGGKPNAGHCWQRGEGGSRNPWFWLTSYVNSPLKLHRSNLLCCTSDPSTQNWGPGWDAELWNIRFSHKHKMTRDWIYDNGNFREGAIQCNTKHFYWAAMQCHTIACILERIYVSRMPNLICVWMSVIGKVIVHGVLRSDLFSCTN